MSDHIEWVLELDVQAGQQDAVQDLVDEMVAATHANEPGALTYEYFLSADKSRCTVIERYADNAAVMIHLGNFGAKFADRFFTVFAATRFAVYGPADDTVRGALKDFGATFDDRISGFSR